MKRNFISLLALVFMAQVVLAVDPNTNLSTYYSSIDGKSNSASSDALRTQLCTVISTGYVSTGYSSLPNSIYAASTDPSDFYNGSSKTMEDIYSSYPYTSSQSGSSATTCGTGWNKEHTVPQSYFGEESPMKSDAHHVFPTDIKMNSVRSNYPYGENNASKDCSTYGYGHLGSSTFAGYSGTVFDPGEGGEHGSYKGDLARVYFYMVTRYRTTDFTKGTGNISFTYTSGVANLTDYMKNLMLKWHRQDPVSDKERIRNNAIYAHQKNRNPYVDYPCLVEYIWGEKVGESVELSALVSAYDASYTGNDCSGGGVDPLDPDYYAPVEGLSDSLLKSKLAEVTWSHYTKRYSYGSGKNNTWEAFWYTDRNEADNSVVDMYSNNKRYFKSDMTASVANCDIEHMFPNSWFGGESGNKHAYCDLHHLVPSDYSANRSKSNRGPGVPTDTTFNNGVWVNGKDAGRDNLEVFCPSDEYKGDFARAFFYIAMAYGDTAVWQAEAVPNHMTNSDWHEFLPLTRDLLLEWHRNDPVSEKERVRMNTVYGLQGNRNPFIDYPCLAEYIWGVRQGEAFNLDCSDTPVPPTKYTITWSVDGKKSTSEVTKGLRPSAPSVTDCSENRVFVGWTTSSTVSEKPAELYTAVTIPAASKAATYYAVYADKGTKSKATEVTDDLTRETTGVTSNSYADWSGKSVTSGAVYAGNTAGGNSSIQMRTTNSNSGVITTTSGGTAKSVVITWNDASDATRVISVYGSNTAYTSAADLYDTAKQGTLLGSLAKGETTLNIEGSYTYIGIRSKSGALYLTQISITWDSPSGGSETSYSNYSEECGEVFDFKALAATEVTHNAFTANWTEAGVDFYTLDVKSVVKKPTEKEAVVYEKEFLSSLGDWTINNISGYENVWTHNSSYGAYATSYVNKERNVAESMLYSPAVDLKDVQNAKVTLNHVFRYGATVYLMIYDGEWKELPATNWTAASSWDFVNSEADLSSYAGKNVMIGFKYVGTTSSCPTWEIKRITISHMVETEENTYESIEGYPQMVSGTSAEVSGLKPKTTYYYTVTPEGGLVSEQIEVTTEEGSPSTGIEETGNTVTPRKMLINGQMYIVLDDRVYDVTGQRVR